MYGVDWNSTDVEDVLVFRDNAVTTAVVGKTGLVASNITARYFKPGMTAMGTLTMTALGSLGAAHADGGFLAVGSPMLGHYRVCISDTMVASVAGANPYVDLCLSGTGFDDVNVKWPLLQPLSGATFGSNLLFINGTTAPSTAGILDVNVKQVGNTAVVATAGLMDSNMTKVGGTTVVATAGLMDSNITKIGGTAVTQVAGIPSVNVSQIGSTAVTQVAGIPSVNATQVGGTTVVATAGVVDARAITLGTAAQTTVRQEARTSVDASISTALDTTARATPTTGAPGINAALGVKIDWMYERAVSRIITTSTSVIQHNGSNVAIGSLTLAGDTATDTRNRFA